MKIERSGKCFDISSLLSSHWIFLSEVLYMEWHWIRYCSRFCERERTMKFWGIKISMDCPFASLLVPVCQSWLSFVVLSNSEDHPDPNYRRNFSHTSSNVPFLNFLGTTTRNWNPGNCLDADCLWPPPRLDVKGGEDPTKIRLHASLLPEKGES